MVVCFEAFYFLSLEAGQDKRLAFVDLATLFGSKDARTPETCICGKSMLKIWGRSINLAAELSVAGNKHELEVKWGE